MNSQKSLFKEERKRERRQKFALCEVSWKVGNIHNSIDGILRTKKNLESHKI